MKGLDRKIKYVAFVFFTLVFLGIIFQYTNLYMNNEYGRAIYNHGTVRVIDENKKEITTDLPANFSAKHYDGQEVDVLYDGEKAFIIEWTYILRNNLFLLMVIVLCGALIKMDRDKEKNDKKS